MKTKKKILVVYYSSTGNTKAVAETIAQELDADLEELRDPTPRNGFFGLVRSGCDVLLKKKPSLTTTKDPGAYDLIILGTPVWAGSIAPALRSYCVQHASALFGCYSVLTTQFGNSPQQAVSHLSTLIGSEPEATVSLQASLIKQKSYRAHLKPFIRSITKRYGRSKRPRPNKDT